MAEIVIHAGMPKTGSTSVQHWLTTHAAELRARDDVHLLVATNQTAKHPGLEVHVEPHESGNLNSGRLIFAWAVDNFGPAIPQRFLDEIDALAPASGITLVTGEALSQLFWRLDKPFLAALEELGRAHEVHVAYYVRPQHTAIESWWCEAGFRQPAAPSTAVIDKTRELHYLQTLDGVERLAPAVDFVMRPFRGDLLDRGNVVFDFARRFLHIDDQIPDVRANVGLSLETANTLRAAPDGLFWNDQTELYSRVRLKAAAAQVSIPESDATRLSRVVLQKFCHETFEAENRALIERLQWPTVEFVPRPSPIDGGFDITGLDTLWQAAAEPDELNRRFAEMKAILDES